MSDININDNNTFPTDQDYDDIMCGLNDFSKKYNNLKNINKDDFKKDCMCAFTNIHKLFSPDIIGDLDNEIDNANNDDKHDLILERNDYVDMINNIDYVLNNISSLNLETPNTEFIDKCNLIIKYHTNNIENMNEVRKSMNELTKKLTALTETLNNFASFL
tara:strand:+ start:9017 stop:9499 length:483 start_codon:yes stop_codon:yes gene_type:complete